MPKTPKAPSETEILFDTEIAPLLRGLHEACAKHGLQHVSCVQFSKGQYALTADVDGSKAAPELTVAAMVLQGEFEQATLIMLGALSDLRHSQSQTPKPRLSAIKGG